MKRQRREPIVLSQMRPVTLFLVLTGCIAVTFALIHISAVAGFLRRILTALGPVFTGFVIAYLLNPAATLLENRFRKWMARSIEKHPKLNGVPRICGALCAVGLFIGSAALLTIATFSQVVNGISTAISQLPSYVDSASEMVQKLLRADNVVTQLLQQLGERLTSADGALDTMSLTQRVLSVVATGAAGTLGFVYNTVIGTIVAVYMLTSKDRFVRQWKRLLYAVVKPKTAKWIDQQMTIANQTFGTAVIGKLIDSVLIGLFCFIGVTVIGTPYKVLIAVIIGVTNIIPYFGPVFGAIPCVLLILMENPVKALYFLIFIVALQQFDANLLDPRIVGQSIGLPAFWELFACLLGGGLFGIIGLIIGVPLFAVLYTLVKQLVTEKLMERTADGELEQEFVRDTLGITEAVTESGFFEEDEDEVDSQYVQHLVLLEDIAETPQKKKEKK